MASKDPILTPELVKILKIFGFSSIFLVLVLALTDTHRANNSGQEGEFRMSDSARLFFLNVRAIDYEREIRQEAGMWLFRHREFLSREITPSLGFVLILHPSKDESYVYLEPRGLEWPIRLLIQNGSQEEAVLLEDGNKQDHFRQAMSLKEQLDQEARIYVLLEGKKVAILDTAKEKEAIKSTFADYFQLLEI